MFTPRLFWAGPWNAVNGDLDKFFTEAFGGNPRSEQTFPLINVWEDTQSYRLEAEVPGLQLEDLEILVLDHEVTLKGDRKNEPAGEARVHRNERWTGPFKRVLRVPARLNADEAEAELKDGLLRLYLPKAKEHLPRKILVKSST